MEKVQTSIAHDETTAGPKRLGLATATFVVISSMIGIGVLTTSGFTVCFVGSNQLMLLLWVLGGVVALCGALSVPLISLASVLSILAGVPVYLIWSHAKNHRSQPDQNAATPG